MLVWPCTFPASGSNPPLARGPMDVLSVGSSARRLGAELMGLRVDCRPRVFVFVFFRRFFLSCSAKNNVFVEKA